MRGSYVTIGNTLKCIVKKKGTASKPVNQDTRKGRNASKMPKFTYEVPEQDLVFVSFFLAILRQKSCFTKKIILIEGPGNWWKT